MSNPFNIFKNVIEAVTGISAIKFWINSNPIARQVNARLSRSAFTFLNLSLPEIVGIIVIIIIFILILKMI